MAVYKIFPEKDTFISQTQPTQNFGRDEILKISNKNELTLSSDVKRSLIQFETSQIDNVINNIISGNYQSYLKLFLANALIQSDYIVETFPLTQSWEMGIGKSSDTPISTAGVTWDTAPLYNSNFTGTQSFSYTQNKDINLDVTSITDQWVSQSIENNGLIVKLSGSFEDTNIPLSLKFFSMDTHTIYPPQLEFKWDDSLHSSSLLTLNNSDFISTISNNKTEFEENTIYKFRIKARDRFPNRQFSTTSVYLNTKALPSTSYWALKDVKTEEMVIDFDTTYTKISCDNISNYFTLYMDGLEPERYYQILYKVVLNDGETIVIDDKSNYFKIVR